MAGPKDTTIRARALDGTWQTIGGETTRGLYPENVSLEADAWGSSAASFNLRRDPRVFFPDIGAFTPIEIDVGSTLVWSGRVRETPAQVAQRTINVQCEGWQFHLDDDIYQRTYAHTNLGDYKDMRSVLSIPLATLGLRQQATVATDGGILLSFPAGTVMTAGLNTVGVLLDLGAGNTAARIVLDWESSNNISVITMIGGATNDPALGSGSDAISFLINSGAVGTTAGTVTPGRYVYLYLKYTNGAATTATDYWVRITGCRVFPDTAYESGNQSVLKASTVVADALGRATVLLSADASGIDTTTFSLPSYAPGWQTVRQAWTAVDAYHDWQKKIDVQRRPIYTNKPTRPIYEVGAHSAIDDEDASANSGAEVYNRAVVSYQEPAGASLAEDVQPTEVTDYVGLAQVANPSADINATGWAGTSGAFLRTTSVFDSAPASFDVSGSGVGGVFDLSASASASLATSTSYRLSLAYRPGIVAGAMLTVEVKTTPSNTIVASQQVSLYYPPSAFGGVPPFYTLRLPWVQDTADTGYTVRLYGSGTNNFQFDSVDVARVLTTVADRRGFVRSMALPISSQLPQDGVAARSIGTVWLADHKTTPFRGSVTLTGDESLRDILTGRDVGLELLLLNTGQLVRFSDRSDPDTGGHGRDGRIAAVTYTPATNSAAVTIDNSRTSFDALLARLAIIQGG